MMESPKRGHIKYYCDTCAAMLDTKETDHTMAAYRFNKEGWKAEQNKDQGLKYKHYCHSCANARKK